MPAIFWWYWGAIALSLAVGAALYYTVGGAIGPPLTAIFGRAAAPFWGRLFRLGLVTTAVVGALSTRWFGCHGYGDYRNIARDHAALAAKTSQQVSHALEYAVGYLVVASLVVAVLLAIVRRAGRAFPVPAPRRPIRR